MIMPRPRKPYLHKEHSRDKTFWYVRRGKGPRIRIAGEYGSDEFNEAYDAAVAGRKIEKGKAAQGSLQWLTDLYRKQPEWSQLSSATRRQRENIIARIVKNKGKEPYNHVTTKTIKDTMRDLADRPAASRHYLDTMRGLFDWAVEAELADENPTKGIKAPKKSTEGHETWTDDWCEKFEAKYPVGTRARLAYDILVCTGFRRGDAVMFGKQHVRNNVIRMKTEKTGQEVVLPMMPQLALSIAKTDIKGDLAFICGARGEPMTKESFGNWFRDLCKEAGIPGSAHGLRKLAATRFANNGATVAELEAWFGWRGGGMASLYTKKADRARLARQAAEKMLAGTGDEPLSPSTAETLGRRSK